MWGEFETVYAVTDYYDGILAGVANFQGSPHVFLLEDGTGATVSAHADQ
jgi:hypothetical protein